MFDGREHGWRDGRMVVMVVMVVIRVIMGVGRGRRCSGAGGRFVLDATAATAAELMLV